MIAIFALIGIIGFFILPAVIKPIAVEKLAAAYAQAGHHRKNQHQSLRPVSDYPGL